MIVKLTTPWAHDFYLRTPYGKGTFGRYKFEIDNDITECDYWIIWGDLPVETKVTCHPENIYYITDEAHEQRQYGGDFLHQFPNVITQRSDVTRSNVIKTHDLGIWHFPVSYDDIVQISDVPKRKVISAVVSNLARLAGHKMRLEFISQIKAHYNNNEIDFYGRGLNFIENKFHALAPYRYSIAIENSFLPNYFTEKIFECFLTLTLPVYYGCPNLEKYFDDRAFVRIDIKDLKKSISIIDDLIKYDLRLERLDHLREAKRVFMEEYMVFPALVKILRQSKVPSTSKQLCVIRPMKDFVTKSWILNRSHLNKFATVFRKLGW